MVEMLRYGSPVWRALSILAGMEMLTRQQSVNKTILPILRFAGRSCVGSLDVVIALRCMCLKLIALQILRGIEEGVFMTRRSRSH